MLSSLCFVFNLCAELMLKTSSVGLVANRRYFAAFLHKVELFSKNKWKIFSTELSKMSSCFDTFYIVA